MNQPDPKPDQGLCMCQPCCDARNGISSPLYHEGIISVTQRQLDVSQEKMKAILDAVGPEVVAKLLTQPTKPFVHHNVKQQTSHKPLQISHPVNEIDFSAQSDYNTPVQTPECVNPITITGPDAIGYSERERALILRTMQLDESRDRWLTAAILLGMALAGTVAWVLIVTHP